MIHPANNAHDEMAQGDSPATHPQADENNPAPDDSRGRRIAAGERE